MNIHREKCREGERPRYRLSDGVLNGLFRMQYGHPPKRPFDELCMLAYLGLTDGDGNLTDLANVTIEKWLRAPNAPIHVDAPLSEFRFKDDA